MKLPPAFPALARLPLPSRRVLLRGALGVVALLALGVIALGGLIASRDLDALYGTIERDFQAETGGTLGFKAKRVLYWPRPRVVLDDVTITLADGLGSLAAGRVVLDFGVLDLVDGVIDRPDIRVEAPVIHLTPGPLARFYQSPRALLSVLDKASASFEGHARLAALRLSLADAAVVLHQSESREGDLAFDRVDLDVIYSQRRSRIDLSAQRKSGPHPLFFHASLPARPALRDNRQAPFTLTAGGFGSHARLDGMLSRAPELALSATLEASLQEALGVALGMGRGESARPDAPTLVSAGAMLDMRGGGLEALKISRDGATLSGIAALREYGGRWTVSATLAGDLVDGTATYAALQRLKTPEGAWSGRRVEVNPVPGLDLDLRLSTRAFRLGRMRFENAALAVFTRKDRAEFSIADAQFGAGSLKARITITERAAEQDIKLLVAGDKLEAARFLDQAFGFNRIEGTGNFVFQLKSHGASVQALAQNLAGTGAFESRNGTLHGFDINRLMSRSAETRPEAALFSALGGKTGYETLSANLAVKNGRIEPVGYRLETPNATAQIEGAIDLGAQRHDWSVVLRRKQDQPGLRPEFFGFRIAGALLAPAIKPDMSLIEKRN